MNQETRILPQKAVVPTPEDGYAFAQLHTTTYGIRLLTKVLRSYIPEPDEQALHAKMLETCEQETTVLLMLFPYESVLVGIKDELS